MSKREERESVICVVGTDKQQVYLTITDSKGVKARYAFDPDEMERINDMVTLAIMECRQDLGDG